MKILVTGSQGFVGQALCKYLTEKRYDVISAVRISAGLQNEYAIGNISANTYWQPALKNINTVIHLAARVHQMHDNAINPLTEFRQLNVDSTLNLARQAAESGVKRIVFTSTIKVNGEGSKTPYKESDTPKPEDPYAISKWEAEQGLLEISRQTGIEIVIVRPPLVYGPGAKGNFASLVSWVRKGWPLPFGSVRNQRSLIALENLVSFLALCADNTLSPLAANQTFVIADGEDISTPDLLKKVAYAHRVKSRLISIPSCIFKVAGQLMGKQAEVDRLLSSLLVDSTKARELLGWRPIISMDEQLRKIAVMESRDD